MADKFEYSVATLTGKESMSMVPQTKFMVFFIKAPKGNYSHKGSIIRFRSSKNMASFHNINKIKQENIKRKNISPTWGPSGSLRSVSQM